jgi:hypothetical protein
MLAALRMRRKRGFVHLRGDARYVEAGEDRVITELVGEHPPRPLEYVRDHNGSALGEEAARVAGARSTGTARDTHGPIIETFHNSFPFDHHSTYPRSTARRSIAF